MNTFDFQAARPVIVYFVGMLSDYLVARGFLLPDQRQMWVQGWVDIITSLGGVLLSLLFLSHESKVLLSKLNTKQKQTMSPSATPTFQVSVPQQAAQTGLQMEYQRTSSTN